MIEVKFLGDVRDLQEIPKLEQTIWGNPDPVPVSLMRVIADHGGGIWGALDGDSWIGFAMALAACDDNGWYLHSHQAGVLIGYRDRGVGRSLKQAQREWAQAHGYARMGWTFDPLRANNAYFNLIVLQARITRYLPDYYGILDSDLNRGLPTDRVFCEWDWDHLNASPLPFDDAGDILIPADIGTLKSIDVSEARHWQARVRTQFLSCLNNGGQIVGFERGPTPRYILAYDSQESRMENLG